jgi:hypothetical protein
MNCLQCLYHAEIKREFETISLIGPPEYCKLKLTLLHGYKPCEYFVGPGAKGVAGRLVKLGPYPLLEDGLREVITELPTADSQVATQLLQEFENAQDVFTLYQLQKFLAQHNIFIRAEDVEHIFRKDREFIVSTGNLSGYAVAAIEALILIKGSGGSQDLLNIRRQLGAVGKMEDYDCYLTAYFNPSRMVKQGLIKPDRKPRLLRGFENSTVFELAPKGDKILSGLEATAIELLKFIRKYDRCQVSEVRSYWLAHCANTMVSIFSLLKERLAEEQWSRPVFDRLVSQGLIDVERVGGNAFRPAHTGDTNLVTITKKGEDALEKEQNILKALSLCDFS